MVDYLIQGGRVVDPAQNLDQIADVLIEDGRIKAIGPNLTPSNQPRILNAKDKWVWPGLIDLHVHLREPGHEYKEDLASGLKAAAACLRS